MRSFRYAVCAAFLLVSAQLVAESAQKPAHAHAKQTGCSGKLIRVFNGPSGKTQCFEPSAHSSSAPANGVVIYNGNQKQTRTFNASSDPGAPVRSLPPDVIRIETAESKHGPTKPVVLGISSNMSDKHPVVVNIASSGSSTQRVVVGVASSGFQTAGAVEPVTTAVSPRPAKRPPYRPEALDRQ